MVYNMGKENKKQEEWIVFSSYMLLNFFYTHKI